MRGRLGMVILLGAAAFGQDFRLGETAAAFSLADAQGRSVAIAPGHGAATVVMFLSAVCPVSNDYNIRINDLYRDYTSKGVKFVFINANQNEKQAEVEDQARRAGYPFPIYRDPKNVVADRFGAQSTPETFLIDGAGVVRYHGRIDD